MDNLPIEFLSDAKATGQFESTWDISSSNIRSRCSIPIEFGGTGGGFSPEELFLQSLINCFLGTLKVIAKGSKLSFSEISVKGRMSVDKAANGKTMMKTVFLRIEILDIDRPDRIEAIVAKVFRDGFILNSVKSEITYDLKLIQTNSDLQT